MGKKRVEKKAEKLRRKKIHDVLDMVLEINTTYPRQRKNTGTMPTAFFDFSAHVSRVYVQIIKDGWNSNSNLNNPGNISLDASVKFNQMEELKGKIEKIQEELRHAGKM